jgi:hypothetical protein
MVNFLSIKWSEPDQKSNGHSICSAVFQDKTMYFVWFSNGYNEIKWTPASLFIIYLVIGSLLFRYISIMYDA